MWLGSVVVASRTCNLEVAGSGSRPVHCQVMTLDKLFTHMCLCHQAV